MNRKKIILGASIVTFSTLLSSFGFYFWQMLYTPNILVEKPSQSFIIPKGSTFKQVQKLLYEGNYVNDLVAFSFLAKLMNYDHTVKAGLYLLTKDMTNLEAIRVLRSGKQQEVNVTFNRARLLDDLGAKVTKHLAMSADDFQQVIQEDSLIHALGFDRSTLIGMFIPNTYKMFWDMTPKALLLRCKKEYDAFWNEKRRQRAQAIGFSPKEVSTLASIVQAETAKPDELPIVAGLYVNRLKKGYPLQADPTLIFAAKDFAITRVLNKHKAIESPYNTYKYAGLPPGPINMPEISALEAVLNYQNHDYLYMCAKEDFSGYHNFAKTLAAHSRNARKYQRALSQARE